MLRAGWPRVRFRLLAADRVVALTGQRGRSHLGTTGSWVCGGPKRISSRGWGGSVLRWPVGRVQNRRVRARPPQFTHGETEAWRGTMTCTEAQHSGQNLAEIQISSAPRITPQHKAASSPVSRAQGGAACGRVAAEATVGEDRSASQEQPLLSLLPKSPYRGCPSM